MKNPIVPDTKHIFSITVEQKSKSNRKKNRIRYYHYYYTELNVRTNSKHLIHFICCTIIIYI